MSQVGTQISSDDIIETLSFFDDWEERYKYIIDLGRELPPLDDAQRTDEHLVRGCQSQVWLVSQQRDDRLFFDADSDAFIVKGLLAVVLAAYNGKRPADIRDFDIEQYFEQLNLIKHLSVTRGNGLRAMVQRIQATAAAAL
ncbi:SufE family protein [Pseudomonas sp. CC6-YY-74]|uniref:SufE family protein n=1 Tax=Pseudomonas sp. CC6-YY-74 TaxID=1930532 RepID=UPI0009A1D5D1|nr:SufE family protein [Pseudomonas sp. CC6-YY-74]